MTISILGNLQLPRPRIFRVFSVGWVSVSVIFSYLYFINAISLEANIESHKKVCTNTNQVEAAISYYEKLLRRNVLLRRILGEKMEYYIQVGAVSCSLIDQNYLIVFSHWPVICGLCSRSGL